MTRLESAGVGQCPVGKVVKDFHAFPTDIFAFLSMEVAIINLKRLYHAMVVTTLFYVLVYS